MQTIRTTAAALIGLAALAAWGGDARAQNYPWCGIFEIDGGMAENCGFTSYQQCITTMQPQGGYCQRNGSYQAPANERQGQRGRR